MKKMIIYGTGDYGKKIFFFLRECGISIEYFCKTETVGLEKCEDIDVISIDELEQHDKTNLILIIALKDRTSIAEIKQMLLNRGFKLTQILDMREFFEDNILSNAAEEKDFGEKICTVCGNRVNDFLPTGEKTDLFSKHNIIGGGYRKGVICPVCHSMDRERWQKYVIEHETGILKTSCRVLHIAPEPSNYRLIRMNPKCDYYTGDIQLGRAMHQIDLTNLQFCDLFFDYIVVNHVLEHIEDEKKAFNEMKRVLKTEGKLILSFPICMDMDTFEDSSIISEEERLKYYGQKDHVRIYGRDYKEYIEQFGFRVEVKSPQDKFSVADIRKFGLIPNDVVMICSVC